MADPTLFTDFRNWPSDDLPEVVRAFARRFQSQVINKILDLPEDYTEYDREVICVNESGHSPVPASQIGDVPASFANKQVKNYKPGMVDLAGSDTLTDDEHCGALILMANSSAATLTIVLSSDSSAGVSNGFECHVLRLVGSESVEIVMGPGLTNRNPDGHTKVAAAGRIVIFVRGTDVYIHGYGES